MSELGSAELGEEKLGVPITPSALPDADETPRDRAEDYVKTAYLIDDGSIWDRFLTTITDEFEHEYATIRDIERHRDIDRAVGAPLEKLGSLVHIDRRHGESDPHFRRRIKLQFQKHTTNATLDEIIDSSTMLLDCEPDQLELRETFDIEPARFDVFIREQALRDANVSVSQYVDLLQDVKGGGIRAVATIGKQFTHRSVYEADNSINDSERGYSSEDGLVEGAPYASMITARHRDHTDFPDEDGPLTYDG